MKDMSIIANKKIINKETNEVRLVVSIDEENRKIHSVLVDEPNAEPSIMAAASYDRRWKLYEEPETEVNETAEPETHDEPMKMSDVVTKLESLFDILNRVYFDNALPKPVITVQSTPKAYGHCSTKKIWKSENDGQYEINIGAEFLNRPSANTAATMCPCIDIHVFIFLTEEGMHLPLMMGHCFHLRGYSDSIIHQIGTNAIVTIVSIVVVQTTIRVDIPSVVGVRVVRRSSDKAHPNAFTVAYLSCAKLRSHR